MSDFKAKTHEILFRLGFHPIPRSGSLQRSPGHLAILRSILLRGVRGTGDGKGREEEGEVKEALDTKYTFLIMPTF